MNSSSRHHHKRSFVSNFFAAMLRPVALLALLLVLAACTNNTGKSAARVEIVQTGLLFTERGQTRQLSARVFDEAGVPIDTPVRWSSSDAANISIASNGIASAERSSGSTQITAMAGEVRSAPLLAVVTTVAAGTVLVSDEQIARGVAESDPDAAPSLDNTYTVVVSGIALPAVGTLMVGTGSAPVAGRVVSAREVAGGVEVTLKLAPLSVLFPGLEINQRFNLADVAATIPESVNAGYTVLREGNTYTFTPRPEVRAALAKAGGVPAGTRTLFQGCEGSINGLGLGDGAAPPFVFEPQPVFSFTIAPALDVIYTEARGLERFVVTAEPTFLIDGTVKATAAFEGKVSCKAELLIFPVPVGGALSVLISGLVPVGVGFELGGKVTVAQMKLGLNSRTSAKAALGLDCESECTFVNELTDFVNTNTPTVDVPGLDDFRVKPEFTAFGYVEAAVGNRVFRSLQFKAFEIKAGPKLEGEFAPAATQIAATDFKSSYKLSLVLNAGFGDDIESVLNILGVVKVGDEVLEKAIDLAGSPTGVLTVDRDRFVSGETAQFQLKLDPATINFLGLYNVSEIVLMRTAAGQREVEVARSRATNGQTTFNFTFIANNSGLTSEFTAFAVTPLLPSALILELDTARASNAAPVAVDDDESVIEGSSAVTFFVLNNDTDADGDALEISAVTQPARGSVATSANGLSLSYRPATGFVGTETFEYTITDSKGGSDKAKVSVEVQPRSAATARLIAVSIATRAGASNCASAGDPDCDLRGSSTGEEKILTEETGFGRNTETTGSGEQTLQGRQSVASGNGAVTLDRADGTVGAITLSCSGSAGFGAGPESPARIKSDASARTTATVLFSIEGETGLRYSIAASGTASAPTSSNPSLPILAGASVNATFHSPRASLFTFTRSSSGSDDRGSNTGLLGPGRHQISIICSASGRDGPDSGYAGGGGSTSGMTVQLTLQP
ncbi:Ig-like domain-containing protein [Stenotrophobium rhamnosiphilum]|uniref:BIG2 domain-containing protein n=1 Tax=Stenotrophobium rhamnosiphilum TaxID=2029166 RepID=A0A2T5MFC7_9GAMM|nr:Ig-like domain-containing protein [Stenotrophobium rhamnosiphilum]PTU31266.1 hypothetical protein CJD38_07900 [Stenotrophobium rhamnosiphilum]